MALDLTGQFIYQPDDQAPASTGGYTPPAPQQPFSWQEFMNLSNQVQQANQAMQGGQMPWQQQAAQVQAPWQQQGQMPWQQGSAWSNQDNGTVLSAQSDSQYGYREMTPLERFSKGMQDTSEWLGSAAGNALFGEPGEGENPYELKLENVPRFLANLPGQIVGSVPDILGYGSEILADAPVREADSETNMIENRHLTNEERMGDIGYTALGVAGFIPGVGIEARAGGLAAKGAGMALSKAGAKVAGEALEDAGMAGIKNQVGKGAFVRMGEAVGKTGAELNAARWGDTAVSTASGMLTEGLQEAGQTYFEDMRSGQLDEGTAGRMLEGGLWGAVGGGVMGVAHGVPATIYENAQASMQQDNASAESVNTSNFFDFRAKDDEVFRMPISSEVQQRVLELQGQEEINERVGGSVKAVAGPAWMKTYDVIPPLQMIVNQWNANRSEITRPAIAQMFGYSVDDFQEAIDTKSQAQLAKDLSERAMTLANDADPKKWILMGENESPATSPNFKGTFRVVGVSAGNTVAFNSAVPTNQNSDLDGDRYQLYEDRSMVDWDTLPTRQLMSMKGAPNGLSAMGYGNVSMGFEESGISSAIGNKNINGDVKSAVRETLENSGYDEKEVNYWTSRIFGDKNHLGSFEVSPDEDKAGVTWKHKLAKTLNDMRENSYREGRHELFGDSAVADVMFALSQEGGHLMEIDRSVKAIGQMPDPLGNGFGFEMADTKDLPRSRGAMPAGRTAPTQLMEYFGVLHHMTSKDSNPMFRFKQSGAWRTKLVKMTTELDKMLGDMDNIDRQVKWCMQMINDLNLPVDYLETMFKTRVLAGVMRDLGINETNHSMKLASEGGFTFDQLSAAFEKNWNELAAKYDKAVEDALYGDVDGSLLDEAAFHTTPTVKAKVDGEIQQSFARAYMDVFGSWDISQLAKDVPGGKSLAAAVEEIGSSPVNMDRNAYAVNPEFQQLFNACLDDYLGRPIAQTAGVVNMLNMGATLNAKFTVEDGVYKWDPIHKLEVAFWHRVISSLLGPDASLYLQIPGEEWLARTGWAKYLLSKDAESIKRCIVAMGVRYNWRTYLYLREEKNMSPEMAWYYAQDSIDMNNPLNAYIAGEMSRVGMARDGVEGAIAEDPLMEMLDPSKGSYTDVAQKFDYNFYAKAAVSPGKDLILYYALDDGKSAVGTSDIGTRARKAKAYRKQVSDNTVVRAAMDYSKLKEAVEGNKIEPQKVVNAFRKAVESPMIQIESLPYAVALHDSASFSTPATSKGDAPNAAAIHAQGVLWEDGGFTTSFLDQLGVSVGAIGQRAKYQITEAVRTALFDPGFSQDILINNQGDYVTISQANVFKIAKVVIDQETGPTWQDFERLFDKAPQLLGYIFPQKVVPVSPDSPSVTTVLVQSPMGFIEDSLKHEGEQDMRERNNRTRVRNAILSDQDSVLLTLGYVDSEYDTLINSTSGWNKAIGDAVEEWTDTIYKIASIPDAVERKAVIEREFGERRTREFLSFKSLTDELRTMFDDASRNALEKSRSDAIKSRMAIRMMYEIQDRYDHQGSDPSIMPGMPYDPLSASEKSRSEQIEKLNREYWRIFTEVSDLVGLRYAKDERGNLKIYEDDAIWKLPDYVETEIKGRIAMEEDEAGNLKFPTAELVDIAFEERDKMRLDNMRASDKLDKSPFIKGYFADGAWTGDTSFDVEEMIGKVEDFVRGRNYKKLESEYVKGKMGKRKYSDLENWKLVLRQTAKDMEDPKKRPDAIKLIRKQVDFWNNEILTAELQRIKDTYGADMSYDTFYRMDQARDFVEEIVEEVAADESIGTYSGTFEPGDIHIPRISFNNQATSPHIEMAGMEIETGLAPISSGQNAGAYQSITILDFMSPTFQCNVAPRTGLTPEQAIELAREQNAPLNYKVPGSDDIREITVSQLEDPMWTEEQIANMQFFPEKDCLYGCCHNHNPRPVTKVGKKVEYLGGRYTIAALCWFLSEKKVFKAKKMRRVFDKIAHNVRRSDELRKWTFEGRDVPTLLQNVQDYQEKLAENIHETFMAEHMDGDFDIDDARILAQFMTPMLEVTYTVTDPETGKQVSKRMTVGKGKLADEAAFAAALGEDVDLASNVTQVRPVAMSLIDVCNKLTDDFIRKMGDETQSSRGGSVDLKDANELLVDCMDEWGGKALDDVGMEEFLQGIPVVRPGRGSFVRFTSLPNAMQNFIEATGDLQQTDQRKLAAAINNAVSFSVEDKTAVKETMDALNKVNRIDTSDLKLGGRQFAIVRSRLDAYGDRTGRMSDGEIAIRESTKAVFPGNIAHDFFSPTLQGAVIMPDLTKGVLSDDAIRQEFSDALSQGRMFLFPTSCQNYLERVVPEAESCYERSARNSNAKATVTINGETYYAIDPQSSYHYDPGQSMPESYLREFDPHEMALSWEDVYRMTLGDSGYKFNPAVRNQKMWIETTIDFTRENLLGNVRDQALRHDLMGGRFTLLGKYDEDGRADMMKEFEKAREIAKDVEPGKHGDYRSTRFILPNFDDTYRMHDDTLAKSVENYLRLGEDDMYDTGVKVGEVNHNECFAVVKVNLNGFDYYMPLIFNTGGTSAKLSKVYLTDDMLVSGGTVSPQVFGYISHEEAEGIKVIFPTIAYKTFATMMDLLDVSNMMHPAHNLFLDKDGKDTFDTMGQYSGQTEDTRLIDLGYTSKLESLGNLGKLMARNYFVKNGRDDDISEIKRSWMENFAAKRQGEIDLISLSDFTRLVKFGWQSNAMWNKFVLGGFRLHADPEVNEAMRKVAQTCLACHISPMYVFATIRNGKRQFVDYNEKLVLSSLTDNELERFYHAMEPTMCYDGANDPNVLDPNAVLPWINKDGMILASDGAYHHGHIHFLRPTDDSSMIGVPSTHANFSSQAVINQAAMMGFGKKSRDIEIANDFMNNKAGNVRAYVIGGKLVDERFRNFTEEEMAKEMADAEITSPLGPKYLGNNASRAFNFIERRRNMNRDIARFMSKDLEVYRDKTRTGGTVSLSALNDRDTENYKAAISKLNGTLGLSVPLNVKEIHMLYKQTTGLTGGDGVSSCTVDQFVTWVDDVCYNIEHGEFPFKGGKSLDGRPLVPYVTSSLLDRLLQSDKVRNRGGIKWERNDFVLEMEEKVNETLEALTRSSKQQREAVCQMIDYISGTYDKPWMSRPLGDTGAHMVDIIESNLTLVGAVERGSGLDLEKAQRDERDRLSRQIEINERRRFRQAETPYSVPGFVSRRKGTDRGQFDKVCRSVTSTSRMMSVLNLMLPISSIALRFKAQGMTKGLMFLNRIAPNGLVLPYDGITLKNRDAVALVADSPRSQRIWRAMNILTWNSEDTMRLQNCTSEEEVEKLLNERMENLTMFERAQERVFDAVSGGAFGTRWQIENFLDRLAATATEESAPLLRLKDENGLTTLETLIEGDPDMVLINLLTTRDDNPYFNLASQARNWVLKNEHAAQSCFSLAMSDLFARHPFGEAIFSTGLCRFPFYAWNVSGWFLNHVAPVSSAAFIVRKLLIDRANKGGGKWSDYWAGLGVERTQIHQSLQEAMMADAMMIGSTMLVGALFGIGAIEPPDDEFYDEYAGNPEEWTIGGLRIKENWWLMDILGPFAAVAATWKSIEIGKPRFDILKNWMSQAMWSNPVVKAADVARSMLDPTESYLEEYDNLVDQYQNIQGGPPDMLEAYLADGVSFGLNWFGQFVTPSFVRELGNSYELQPFERSYKKVKNEDGEYEYTTYVDSQIRKVTRKNPVLGLIMNTLTGMTGREVSGYTAWDMPKVMVPDENQRSSMEYFSMYNADGTDKPEEQKMAIAFEALMWLQNTDDVKTLMDNGFALPVETRIYMSQMLNDWKQYEQDQYNDFVQQTGLDAYVLGNGDFTEGMKRKNLIQSGFYADLKDIDALFDKVWSDELRRGMQMYYRENTTYNQTASGEWYATGMRRTALPLPVIGAPGTVDGIFAKESKQGTMGREGNWETPSEVVAGRSAGGRALIPIEDDLERRPKLADFGDDDNGGYSDTAAGKAYAESRSTSALGLSGSPYLPYSTRSSGGGGTRRYGGGGGGGGGGSRYSGGGRSYVPNIYAPSINAQTNSSVARVNSNDNFNLPGISASRAYSINTRTPDVYAPSPFRVQNMQTPNQMRASTISPTTIRRPTVNMPDLRMPDVGAPILDMPTDMSVPRAYLSKPGTTRIMNEGRYVNPTSVMMRPEFETKGSREAYKRSDI